MLVKGPQYDAMVAYFEKRGFVLQAGSVGAVSEFRRPDELPVVEVKQVVPGVFNYSIICRPAIAHAMRVIIGPALFGHVVDNFDGEYDHVKLAGDLYVGMAT